MTREQLLKQLGTIAWENKITHTEISNKTHIMRSNVTTLLGGKKNVTLDKLLKVCEALNVEIEIKEK